MSTATRVVDVHSHYVPGEVLRDARRGRGFDGLRTSTVDGIEWLEHRQGFRYPVTPGFHDLDARLAAMDAMGIDQAVISIAPTLYMYWLEPAAAIEFAALANESMARIAAASRGRLVAAATLPMQAPEAAAAELARAVTTLGMRGVEIAPMIEGRTIDDPALRPVLTLAAELGAPIIMHSSPFEARPAGLDDFYLRNLVGNPLATVVGAARLIFSGALDELPELKVVLMHGGGYLPYQIGRLDHGNTVRSEAKACQHKPSDYLGRFAYDTILHNPSAVRYLVDSVGADRVVYGTDYAYDMGGGTLDSHTDGAKLTDEENEQIAWRNATALFGLQ